MFRIGSVEHELIFQIRTLLIDCFVMTTLFYPSIAAFIERGFDAPSSHPAPPIPSNSASTSWRPIQDAFYPDPPPLLPNLDWGPWWAPEGDRPWVATTCSAGASSSTPEIDVLRVAWADVGGVLDGENGEGVSLLEQVRKLANEWEDGAQCVRHLVPQNGEVKQDGPCFIISPDGTEGTTSHNDLWGSFEVYSSIYRAVAIPFRIRGDRQAFESEWNAKLAGALVPLGAEVFTESWPRGVGNSSTLVSVSQRQMTCPLTTQFSPTPPASAPKPKSNKTPRIVFVLYALLLFGLLYQLSRNATKVHSPIGLAFTGIVQLCCSALMSSGVLAVLGWNDLSWKGWGWSKGQTVLPTYVLPFVIVVVGVENMSVLTRAVFSVPFTHSVPERIGIGLSKVGGTMFLTSCTDLLILAFVSLCVHLQPVREFCIFAAVVIIADWFMLNTFFLTVLSIDAQRLELADVLASKGGLSATEAKRREDDAAKRRAGRRAARINWRKILRARVAKSGSLILLLTSVGVIYWFTERGRINPAAALYGYVPTMTSSYAVSARPTTFATAASSLLSITPSEELWRAINPRGLASVRIAMLPTSIVVLPRPGHALEPTDIRLMLDPTKPARAFDIRPVWHLFKFVVVPLLSTPLALYGLLRFLLKDSDKLTVQRNHLKHEDDHGSEEESDDEGRHSKSKSNSATISVYMLPASHEFDVDVIAAGPDGKLAVSIGIDNTMCLWRFTDDDHASGTREMLTADASLKESPAIGAAVSRDNSFVAIATRCGLIQFWATPEEGKTESLGVTSLFKSESLDRVTAIAFEDSQGSDDPFTTPSATGLSVCPTLLAAASNGSVHVVAGDRAVEIIPAVVESELLPCRTDLFSTENGHVAVVSNAEGTNIWHKRQSGWTPLPLGSALPLGDRVTAAARCVVPWQDRSPEIFAVGRRSGRVDVFDAFGEPFAAVHQASEPIKEIAIATPGHTRCTTCGTQSAVGFFVISSTASQVFIDRVVNKERSLFCRCQPVRRSTLDDALASTAQLRPTAIVFQPGGRQRSMSGGVSNAPSPVKAGLAPPSDFPVSSHGTRRLSGYRTEDRPPSPMERNGSFGQLGSLAMTMEDTVSMTPLKNQTPNEDQTPAVVPLGGVLASDGGWGVLDDTLVGVRRNGSGIDDSQWQVWSIDLRQPWNGSVLLVETSSLEVLERRTGVPPRTGEAGEVPMRQRRAERILSLNGRASFPHSGSSNVVPTHQPLGYVAVRPLCRTGRGPSAVLLAGFGNRVGILGTVSGQNRPPAMYTAGATTPNILATPRRPTHFPLTPPPPMRANGMSPNGSSNGTPSAPAVAVLVNGAGLPIK